MQSVDQFLSYMNDIDFKYVVLRNWDGLPFQVKLGAHSDLDLLVYDYDHFKELFAGEAQPTYPHPRVQYKVRIKDSYIFVDVRSPDDGYYPPDFAHNILNHRVWNTAGFWTPDSTHHRIALGYHAVHHKGFIAPEYQRWLGNVNIPTMLDALKQSIVGWTPPEDHTVGQFNSYLKGATSVVSTSKDSVRKKQYRFKDNDLIKNEHDILSAITCDHFPKIISMQEGELDIEHCGEPIEPKNLPPNWEWQLGQIVKILSSYSIVHRDIRLENLMVKDKIIKLIDFGWAKREGHKDFEKLPDLLGYPNKAPWGFDDSYSMGKVIRQINARIEENT